MKSSFQLIFFALIYLSCNSDQKSETDRTEKDSSAPVVATPEKVRPAHWGYAGDIGPDKWATLAPVYALCGSGTSQSPIDLLNNSPAGAPSWKMEYKTSSLQIAHNEHMEELIDNGHTIQVTPQQGSTMTFGDKVYHLKQFHFHTPSEHTLNGKHAPMEIHFVHQSDDGNLAVVGVMVQNGAHNKNFDQLIRFLPNAPGEKNNHDSINISIGKHLPSEILAYHYVGSLTTPPCTENVQWMVLKSPLHMAENQISEFSSRLKNNNRPSQKLNDRKLTIDDITSKN